MRSLEPVLVLLVVMVVFFTGCAFAAEHFFGSDEGFFQVISGLLTGFSGALLMRVKPPAKVDDIHPPPPGGTSISSVTETVALDSKN